MASGALSHQEGASASYAGPQGLGNKTSADADADADADAVPKAADAAADVPPDVPLTSEHEAKGAAFRDRYPSHFFNGGDSFAIVKAMAPIEVLVGVGALLAVLLPRAFGITLAALLLVPPAVRVLLQSFGIMRNPSMEHVLAGRVTARIEGDFCVLLIGARCNTPWKLSRKFKELGDNFTSMIKELEGLRPESSGYLGAQGYLGGNWLRGSHTLTVIYWRSYEDLLRYAHSSSMRHVPVWLRAEKESKQNTDVGFWHEAFKVVGGKYDSVYVNCPPLGMGQCGKIQPAVGRFRSSRGRSGESDGKDLPRHITEKSAY